MMKKRGIIFFLLLFFMLQSCYKELVNINDLDIASGQNYDIVIEGFITNEKTIYEVQLTRPEYYNDSSCSPVNNAEVKLMQGDNEYQYFLTDNPGVYQTVDSISATVGESYTLVVKVNDTTYYATDSLVKCDSTFNYPVYEVSLESDFYNIVLC